MKVIFMGTPEFAVPTLNRLYEEKYDIPLVITQPDKPKGRGKAITFPPIKERALGLNLNVLQPNNVNDSHTIDVVKNISPDVIVVVAYGQILKEELLNMPKLGCINVHASLLPLYRGAAPINWAVINGESATGITTMLMNKGLDSGDILLMKETNIHDGEKAGQLHDRLMYMGADLLIDTLKKLENGEIARLAQNHSNATYAPIMNKNLGRINWHDSSIRIKNLVNGTNPWPCAFTTYKEEKMKIHDVEICNKFSDITPGKVFKVDTDGIYVGTGNGSIVIKSLQVPGKRIMKVNEFLNGNEFESGITLI